MSPGSKANMRANAKHAQMRIRLLNAEQARSDSQPAEGRTAEAIAGGMRAEMVTERHIVKAACGSRYHRERIELFRPQLALLFAEE